MKFLSIAVGVITLLLVLSTLICGLWLKSTGADVSGVAFHMKLGIASVVSASIGSILLFVLAGKI